MGQTTPLAWLALVEHELLLFSAVFFLIGAIDEIVVDLVWLWLLLTGRARSRTVNREEMRERPLGGPAAVLIPAWQEERVLGATVAHALTAWPQADLCLFVGCYRNDPATMDAALRAGAGDPRMRLVVLERNGPTTKADCLNGLYAALEADERSSDRTFRLVVLHDAEDMVDPAALGLLDDAVAEADFVQLPVLPVVQRSSRLVGSHYCDEFAEQHAKVMVVREALLAGLPAAGVGCAFSRGMLGRLARETGGQGPFSVESLTEDYELGLQIKAAGGRSRFLRVRGEDGRLIATRACFPSRFGAAVRQKSRWIHGIALQGWDRLGWTGGLGERWMRLRDRRGPLSALVLLIGYVVFALGILLFATDPRGVAMGWPVGSPLGALVGANVLAFAWRAAMRFAFTAREYGWTEGIWALGRIFVANFVAIGAGARALQAYVRTLRGEAPRWDKTHHDLHPAAMSALAGDP